MYDDNTVGGINETELDDLILQLNNKIDSITTTLNDVKMKFYDTNEFFTCDVASDFQKQFKAYSDQYELLKDNLNSYVRDLMNVKSMMGKIDTAAFNKLEELVESTAKKVENKIAENEAIIANTTITADTSSQKDL